MAVKENMGQVGCLCCGESIPAKQGAGGALSVSCPWCDFSAYAKAGTQAYRIISGKLKKAAPESAPGPVSVPQPAPQPAPKPKSTLWG